MKMKNKMKTNRYEAITHIKRHQEAEKKIDKNIKHKKNNR